MAKKRHKDKKVEPNINSSLAWSITPLVGAAGSVNPYAVQNIQDSDESKDK